MKPNFMPLFDQSSKFLTSVLLSLFCFGTTSQAFGYGHSYVNDTRSSINHYVFVSQSISGEYGKMTGTGEAHTADDGKSSSFSSNTNWKGFGIKTAAGLELMKFLQFELGHTFINLRQHDSGFETLSGSRFNAGAKLVFRSPLVNLEGGLGMMATRLDYQNGYLNSDLFGTGVYYTMGLNYFVHSKFSVQVYGKTINEHLVRNGGSQIVKEIDTNTNSVGAGFTLWL